MDIRKTSLMLLLQLGTLGIFQASFAQHVISHSVFSNGGRVADDSSSNILGSVSQPIIGVVSGKKYITRSGFWNLQRNLTPGADRSRSDTIPKEFRLAQNYPNPFNPVTTVQFELPRSAYVQVILFDLLGRKVATLLDEELQAGLHKLNFDASHLSSGIYFYRFKADGFVRTKKLMFLK